MKLNDGGLQPPGVQLAAVQSWRNGQADAHADWLAEEVPVALIFNGISHAVMLATPDNLEEFALGFGLTEGLLHSPAELYGVEVQLGDQGIEVMLEVASACAYRLKERRRTMAGRTGCGLCGTESLHQVRRTLPQVPPTAVSSAALGAAQNGLRTWQAVQQLTGASHAAAWCHLDGTVALVREDVGRHNALDKLAGAMVRAGVAPDQGFVCVTSRASFEMVQKTAMMGVGLLCAVSAPTALAVETALGCGLALAGFSRGPDFVAYAHPERLGLPTLASTLA